MTGQRLPAAGGRAPSRALTDEEMLMLSTLVRPVAAANVAASCIGCAIVAALAENGAIDPARAVAWAEWMSGNLPPSIDKDLRDPIANTLRSFATMLHAMSTAPADATMTRQ